MLLKIDFSTSHESCIDNLSAHSFQDPMKNRGYHGPSRWFLTLSSAWKRFKQIKANCHLPLTLPPKERDTDNQVSFWYTLSAKTSLEWKISTSHHPSLVQQKAVSTVLVMASWFSQLAVCCCHCLWLTLVFSCFCLSWWSVIPSGPLALPTNAKHGSRSP